MFNPEIIFLPKPYWEYYISLISFVSFLEGSFKRVMIDEPTNHGGTQASDTLHSSTLITRT